MGRLILGKVSFTPKGSWNPDIEYDFLDVVEYDGSAFAARRPSKGVTPVRSDNPDWMMVVERGDVPTMQKVTLESGNWGDNQQVVNVVGLLADETKQLMTWHPQMLDAEAAKNADIICAARGEGTLTFKCTTPPASDISIFVVTQEVVYQSFE